MNLVPLRDLLTMDAGQIVGNLLVFAALGFLGPLLDLGGLTKTIGARDLRNTPSGKPFSSFPTHKDRKVVEAAAKGWTLCGG